MGIRGIWYRNYHHIYRDHRTALTAGPEGERRARGRQRRHHRSWLGEPHAERQGRTTTPSDLPRNATRAPRCRSRTVGCCARSCAVFVDRCGSVISGARVLINSRISSFDVQTVLGRQAMVSQTRACSLDLGCPSQLTSESAGPWYWGRHPAGAAAIRKSANTRQGLTIRGPAVPSERLVTVRGGLGCKGPHTDVPVCAIRAKNAGSTSTRRTRRRVGCRQPIWAGPLRLVVLFEDLVDLGLGVGDDFLGSGHLVFMPRGCYLDQRRPQLKFHLESEGGVYPWQRWPRPTSSRRSPYLVHSTSK